MKIHPDQLEAIEKLIPKNKQQLFLDHAIEEALKNYKTKKIDSGITLELFVDGGSRGNPGPAGGGFAVYKKRELILSGSEFFGIKTNNQSEYLALKLALQEVYGNFGDVKLNCFMDSQLAVEQVNGRYKVKSENIKLLHQEVMMLTKKFSSFKISHIPREQNKMADKLANEAMDRGK